MRTEVILPNGETVAHYELWTYVRYAKRLFDLEYCGKQLLSFLPEIERLRLAAWAALQAGTDTGKDFFIWAVIPFLYVSHQRKKSDPSCDLQYLFQQIQQKRSAVGILF